MNVQKTLSNWMINLTEEDPSHLYECQGMIKATCEVMINNPIPDDQRKFYKSILVLSQADLMENSAKLRLIEVINLLLDYFFCSEFSQIAHHFEDFLRSSMNKSTNHNSHIRSNSKIAAIDSNCILSRVGKSFLEKGEIYSFGDTSMKVVDIRHSDRLSVQWITRESSSPQEITDNGAELKIGRNRDVNFRFKNDLRISKYHAMLGRENGKWYIRDNNSRNGVWKFLGSYDPTNYYPNKYEIKESKMYILDTNAAR